jgi:hypothetical protein
LSLYNPSLSSLGPSVLKIYTEDTKPIGINQVRNKVEAVWTYGLMDLSGLKAEEKKTFKKCSQCVVLFFSKCMHYLKFVIRFVNVSEIIKEKGKWITGIQKVNSWPLPLISY